MPPAPPKYPVHLAPAYLAELRARVEAVGIGAVAEAAGLVRQTLWRQLSGRSGRNPNPDAVERIRRALAAVAPGEVMPPPLVAVRGRAHHAWIKVADKLDPAVLELVAADPAALVALVKRGLKRK